MSIDFKTLIGVTFDTNQAQQELDRQIKSLQKNSKLALDIELSDKQAGKIIQDQTKMWSNYRKEAVSAMTAPNTELQKMAQYYKNLEREVQNNISSQKKLFLAEEQAYKINQSLSDKEVSSKRKSYLAIEDAYKINNKLNDSLEVTKNRASGAGSSFSSYLKKLKPQALKEYAGDIKEISNSFSKAQETGDKVDYSKATSQLSKFKSEMKNAGMETASFSQVLKNNVSAFTNWYFIGNAVSSVVRNFKDAIGTIVEVDTLLTEISKTSDITTENLKKLGIAAFDAASKYGVTAQGYLSGVQEMSRAGFAEGQAKQLAELSILAQSAGDMTAELANQYLIATNFAYGYEGSVEKLNAVLDSQNQVTNRNAVNMTELAEATKIAGSQASQSGVEVDEMTSAVGTMMAVTQQGGSVAGRAFKALLMNLQKISGEVDGEVIDEDSFKKVEKTLGDVGVAMETVVDGSARLRDPIEVLKELASVYNSLPDNSVEKADIIGNLGGKYYGNQLAALLSNWDTYEKMLSDYQNASGSAAQEAQKTADSVEGKLNKFNNTWNRTVANVVDSDLLKGFIDIGTGAIDLVDKLDLLQTALIALGGFGAYKGITTLVPMLQNATNSAIAFGNALNKVKDNDFASNSINISQALSGLNQKQILTVLSTKQMSEQLRNMSSEQIITALTTAGLSDEEAKNTVATLSMSKAQGTTTATTVSLTGSLKALGAAIMANPIGLIITGLTVGISALSFGINKYKQNQEELVSGIQESVSVFDEQKESIDSQLKSITDLKNKLDSTNLSTEESASIKSQLLEIQGSLINSYGSEAEGLDLVNGKLSEQIEIIQQLNKEQASKWLTENKEKSDKSIFQMEKDNRHYNLSFDTPSNDELGITIKGIAQEFKKQGITLNESMDGGTFTIHFKGTAEEAEKTIGEFSNKVRGLQSEFGEDNDIINNILGLTSDSYNKAKETLDQYQKMYNDTMVAKTLTDDKTADSFMSYVNSIQEYNNALTSGNGIEEAKENYLGLKDEIDKLSEKYPHLAIAAKDADKQVLQSSNNIATSTKESAAKTAQAIQNTIANNDKAIEDYQKNLKTIEGALKDINSISSGDIVDLIQEFSSFNWGAFGVTGAQGVGDLKAALEALAKQQYDSLDTALKENDAFRQMYESAINSANGVMSLSDALSALSSTGKTIEGLKDEIKKIGKISGETVQSLMKSYPQLTQSLTLYLAGKTTEKQILSELSKVYEVDLQNYKNATLAKLQTSESFYTEIGMKDAKLISSFNENYGVDLKNVKNYAQAKLAIENQLLDTLKINWSRYYNTQLDSFTSEYSNLTMSASNGNVGSQKQIRELNEGVQKYRKAIDALNGIAYKGIDVEGIKWDNNKSGKSGGSKKEFDKSIDWTIIKIQNLEKELKGLNTLLENTHGWNTQLKIQDKIIAKQSELAKAYTRESSYYKQYYNQQKKTVSSSYVNAIEKGTKFNIEDFTGREKTYDKVQKVQEAWNQLQDAEQNALNAKFELADAQDKKLEIRINQYSAIIDKLNAQSDNYASWKKQNELLKEATNYQKKSYSNQIKLAKTDEERVKLQEELKTLLAENAKAGFDNIQAYYDNRIKFNESRQQRLQSEMSLTETKGYEVGAEFYNKLITLNKNEAGRLNVEKKALQKSLDDKVKSGDIVKYSQKWYDMMGVIYDVGDAITNANKNIVEFQNSLRQLSWDRFDDLLDTFNQLISESDFLIDLMGNKKLINDNGGYTKEGLATQGQYGVNYNTYMSRAKELDKELAKLDKNSLDKNVQDRIKELTQARYDAISAAESEKQAMIDLAKEGVQAEIDSFAELIIKKKEALDAERVLYEYQKSIAESKKSITLLQKQINALSGDDSDEAKKKMRELKASLADAQSDLDDKVYDKNVEDRKQYLDDELTSYTESMEAYMDNTDLMFEDILDSVNKNTTSIAVTLDKTAEKVGYSLTKNMSDVWVTGKEAISNYTKNFTQKSVTILSVLDSIRDGWSKINEEIDKNSKLSADATEKDYISSANGENPSSSYKSVLGTKSSSGKVSGNSQLNQYLTGLGYKELDFQGMYELGKALGTGGILSVKDVDNSKTSNGSNRNAIMKDLQKQLISDFLGAKKYPADKNSSAYKDTTRVNRHLMDQKYQKLSAGGQVELARLLGLSGITTSNYTTDSNLTKILNALKSAGFSKGGIASKVNKVIKRNGDEGIATLRSDELVLDPKKSESFYKLMDYAPEFIKVMKGTLAYDTNKAFSGYKNSQGNSAISERNNSTTVGDVNLVIQAPNVKDSESLVAELKTPRVKELIRHAVLDIPMGRGHLNLNKY